MPPKRIAVRVSNDELLPLRARYREEMNCQIVHDSIHVRPGWTESYKLEVDGLCAGYGAVAVGGPWKAKPAALEFYVLPEHRTRAFDLFEAFLKAGRPPCFEAQSNDVLFAAMVLAYGRQIASEKIVFHDKLTTSLRAKGAVLKCATPTEEILKAIELRRGGGEWVLEADGAPVGKGGILFHYNRPYGDIYMEINRPFRRRGFGSYLVQELKRACYALGALPCARCSPANVASRNTLQRAGFVPFAHILIGRFAPRKRAKRRS
jgi:GNAT superfamily N-acetyltransferase